METYVILLIALLVTVVASARLRNIPLRRIAAYDRMQLSVSESVESNRATHVSFGSSAVRDATTITALISAEVAYQVAARAVPGDKAPLFTLSDPVTLGLAQDRLRRALRLRDRLDRYQPTGARWYPQGPLSLAFAAGVGEAILDDDLNTNILIGRFGPEMMLIAENAVRYDRSIVAQSDTLEGQAVAYVVSDVPLLGEELYVGAAYLERTPTNVGGVVTQDVLRYLTVATIIIAAILSFLGASL